jgi:3-oxoacyl-[acyl-carrier-protein] synthase II
MEAALADAGLSPSDIDYLNTHGTSTPLGDDIELKAIERLFGEAAATLSVSSTKSAIGHLLGAAGAVEAAFCALAIRDGVAPPTLNLDHPTAETGIDLTPKVARRRPIRAALSNSFGFGGTNAALVLVAPPP